MRRPGVLLTFHACIAAVMATACVSTNEPLAPHKMTYTTLGFRYQTVMQRAQADANRARLAQGMTVNEVVTLLGIPVGDIIKEAIAESWQMDIHYGIDLLKFREGRLAAFSTKEAVSNAYQITELRVDPFGVCNAACGEFNLAVRKGDAARVEVLLKANPSLAASNTYDRSTPIHAAIANGDVPTATLLLANRADLTVRDQTGQMPLHLAARKGNDALVKLLLGAKADVNAKSTGRYVNDETPLHMAALQGHTVVAKTLVASGAEINAKTWGGGTRGETPLSYAAGVAHLEMVTLLLASGADVNGAGGDAPLGGVLFNRGNIKGRPYKEVTELLVRSGADVNEANSVGVTPLHFAAMRGDDDAIRLLLAHNANVHAKNQRGETPLALARARKHPGAEQLLLQAGARE